MRVRVRQLFLCALAAFQTGSGVGIDVDHPESAVVKLGSKPIAEVFLFLGHSGQVYPPSS